MGGEGDGEEDPTHANTQTHLKVSQSLILAVIVLGLRSQKIHWVRDHIQILWDLFHIHGLVKDVLFVLPTRAMVTPGIRESSHRLDRHGRKSNQHTLLSTVAKF